MNLFSYIKSHVSIVTVVGEYATLKKSGIYLKAPCPFHSEKTPSFTVSPHKEIFYCFGCHEGGDVITFIAKVEHCSPIEAAKHLVDRYNLSVPENYAKEMSESTNKKRYFDICQHLANWFSEQLAKSAIALNYIASRGMDPAIARSYQVGYFPGGLHSVKHLLMAMQKENILADDLIEIQVLSRGKQVLFSPFEERILFPIADHLGRVCGFGGRVFKVGDARPKYYNSHENEFFTKGHLLFGLNRAKKEIQTRQKVFLVEGYTDVLALAQYGYGNVVATLGTACTLEHLKTLSRYAQEVYLLYDGDAAGVHAMVRIAELCWQADLDLRVVPLPAGEDPASYVAKKGTLDEIMPQAQNIFSYFIAQQGSQFETKTLADKLAATRKVVELIAHVPDSLKQDLLLQQASQTLALPLASLRKEIESLGPEKAPFAGRAAPVEKLVPKPLPGGESLEKKIFYAIVNNIGLLTSQNEEFIGSYIGDPYKAIVEMLRQEKAHNPTLTFADFFQLLCQTDQQVVSHSVLEYQETVTADVFEQLIVQLQKKHWKVLVNEIKLRLESARRAGNEQEMRELMQEFITLQKKVLDTNKAPKDL